MPKVKLNTNERVRERQRTLYERYGGYMTTANVMVELGNVSRPTAMKFLSDIPSYAPTGKKVYDIADIAGKLEESRVPARGTA